MDDKAVFITAAVKSYLDQTARAHDCAGFDCSICSINRDRYTELKEIIESALKGS
jgi:hypothetical protein